MKTMIPTLLTIVLLAPLGAQTPTSCEDCPTLKKVVALASRWEAAERVCAQQSEIERAATRAKMGVVAGQCPVGRRLSPTLAVVRDAVSVLAAHQPTHPADCPLVKAGLPEAECAPIREMMTARSHVVSALLGLANHAASATCCDATACGGASTMKVSTGAQPVDVKTPGACAAGTPCPIRIASRIGAARASLETALAEVSELSPTARSQVLTGLSELAPSAPVVALLPDTVQTLTEGLGALDALHDRMTIWTAAHPEIMGKLPESSRLIFRMETALTDEARSLMEQLALAAKALHTRAQ